MHQSRVSFLFHLIIILEGNYMLPFEGAVVYGHMWGLEVVW
jgi:hypothetical protein